MNPGRGPLALRIALCLATALLFLMSAASSQAQRTSDKPVHIVVGFAPGGSSDIVARLVAQQLAPLTGQPVIVDNRPGAGGIIASDIVAKSAPDGLTLLLATAGHPTAAAIMKKLPFDALNDFSWVSLLTTYPFVIATRPDSPIRSLGELIVQARAAPGKISFGTTGAGASQHMLPEWFSAETGIEMLHVPFKGGTAVVGEVMAGRVDLIFETMTLTLPHVKSGKLRALAVTSREPASFLPDVPAAIQTVPGFEFQSWLGIAAPPRMPATLVERLNRDLRRVLAEPEVQKRLAELGGRAAPTTPTEMRNQVEMEIARWTRTVETRKIEKQ